MPATPVIHRPLAGVAVAFLGGTSIGLADGSVVSGGLIAIGAALVWGVVRGIRASGRRRDALLSSLCLIAILGVAWSTTALRRQVAERRLTCLLETTEQSDRPRVRVSGEIVSEPRVVAGRRSGWRHSFWFRPNREILVGDEHLPHAGGDIQVQWYGPHPDRSANVPTRGQSWMMSGRARAGRRRDGSRFLRVVSNREHSVQLFGDKSIHGLQRLSAAARAAAARRLALGIEEFPETVSLLHAMLLGYRRAVSPALAETFRMSGTLHVFAISGLHVGMLCVLLLVVMPALGIERRFWVFVIGPVLVFYAVSTGWRPSAWRATVMALIYFVGPTLGRKPDILSALCAAAIGIVAYRPQDLHEAGFVFSFVVVLGIILLGGVLRPLFRRLLVADTESLDLEAMEQASDIESVKAVKRLTWKMRACHYLADVLAISLAAWCSAAPLMAHYFGRVTPVGIVANLLVVPGAFMVVLCGWLSLVTGSIWSGFSVIFNHAAMVLVTLLVGVNRLLAAIPGGSWQIPKLSLGWVFAVYTALIAGTYVLWQRRPDDDGAEWLK